MTELQIRQKFIKTAESYLGCKESDGSHKKIIDIYNTIKPLPAGYKMKYTDAWCAAYVSAMGSAAGLGDIILPECSCERMVKLYQKVGLWVENDAYRPQIGDLIFYDWDDSGSGDNTGRPDHVGIVYAINGDTMTLIEGNISDKVGTLTKKINSKNIRGFATPNFTSKGDKTITMLSGKIETNIDLANAAMEVARNYKTLYVNGCFGAPMTDSNKKKYCNNTSYNRKPERTAMIMAASADTFGFDCVCFVKGLLWGWKGDPNHVYGGASYGSNGVPDCTEKSMLNKCSDISNDFSNIEVGEYLWMDGHAGIYVGDGLSVECTPKWTNNVQITACNRDKSGYNRRDWTKHGKLPYIKYIATEQKPVAPIEPYTYDKFMKEIQSILKVPVTGVGNEATLNATVTLSASVNQTHPLVKPVQKYLYSLGYTEIGGADGEAGPLFDTAVKNYQYKMLGYKDGEITAKEKTWQKLINFTPAPPVQQKPEEPKEQSPAPAKPVEPPKSEPTPPPAVTEPEAPKQETPTPTPVVKPESPKQEAPTVKPEAPAPTVKPEPSKPVTSNWEIGDEVKLVAGAKYANGKTPLSWVYNSKLYIRDFRENESAVISTQKAGPITGVVYLKDLVPYNSAYDVIITANLLNVRYKPTTNSDIVNQIKKDTRHTIYEEENGWGHILNSGWISLNYARRV